MRLEWLSENEKYLEEAIMDYKEKERKFLEKVRRAIPLLKIEKRRSQVSYLREGLEKETFYYEDNAVGFYIGKDRVDFMGETCWSLDEKVCEDMKVLASAVIRGSGRPLIYWRRWLWSLKYKHIFKNLLKKRF